MSNDTANNSNLRPVNVFSLILIAIGALFVSMTFFRQAEPVPDAQHYLHEEKRILSPSEVAERAALARMKHEGVNQALVAKRYGKTSTSGLSMKKLIQLYYL